MVKHNCYYLPLNTHIKLVQQFIVFNRYTFNIHKSVASMLSIATDLASFHSLVKREMNVHLGDIKLFIK